jgi:hypothetical protein
MSKNKVIRTLRKVAVSTPKGSYSGSLTQDQDGLIQLAIHEQKTTPVREEVEEIVQYVKKELKIGPAIVDFDNKPLDKKTIEANGRAIKLYLDSKDMTVKKALEQIPSELTEAIGSEGDNNYKAPEVLAFGRAIEVELGIKIQTYFEELPTIEKIPSYIETSKMTQKEVEIINIYCNLNNRQIRQFVQNYIHFK